MSKIPIIAVILILYLRFLSASESDNSTMPIPIYPWDDESTRKVIQEIDALKASIVNLKIHSDLQKSLLEQQSMKLEILVNRTNNLGSCVNAVQETATKKFPSNCAEALVITKASGIYSIKVDGYAPQPFLVYCDALTQGGGWTVIQRRLDGSVDFLRKWADYKQGFGNLNGEFFVGLQKLHALTTDTPQELLIVMEDFDNVTKYAKYDAFAIGNEDDAYALNLLGSYSGDSGDSLTFQATQKFTTIDRDNDINPPTNCASVYHGAWWYSKCHASNLNGLYLKGEYGKDKYAQGIVWAAWKGAYYSLKSVQMLIRPKRQL